MSIMFQAHQGDVYIRQVESISGTVMPRENGRVILAHGEVTGHAHAMRGPQVCMFRDDGLGRSYLKVDAPEAVTHEEHAAIILPAGLYEVTIQAQYTPAEIQRVAD